MNYQKMNFSEVLAIWSLGTILALRMFGTFIILPILTTYGMNLKEANEVLIGLAIGIYGVMQAIFQIPFGFLSDRIGRKLLIIIGFLFFIFGSMIAALTDSIWGIIIGRAFQGISAISSVIMALLFDLTRESNRAKAMALIGVVFSVTFAAATILSPIITYSLGLQALFFITAILAAVGILLIIFIVPNENNNYVRYYKFNMIHSFFKNVFTKSYLIKLNFSIMCLHILLTSLFLVLPRKLIKINFSIDQYWKIYLVTMLVSFIFVLPCIKYAEIYHCIKRVLILSVIFLLCSEIILMNYDSSLWKITLGIQIFFIAFNMLEALLPSLLSKESPIEYRGTAIGVFSTSRFLGIAIGSLLGGYLNNVFCENVVFLIEILLTSGWLMILFNIKEPSYLDNLNNKNIKRYKN